MDGWTDGEGSERPRLLGMEWQHSDGVWHRAQLELKVCV
jgi:hypothetical protein